MKKSFILLVLACSFVGASAQTGKGYDRANMNLIPLGGLGAFSY